LWLTGSQAMAGRAAAPWPGADGIRERESRFNNFRGPNPASVKSRGFFLSGG